MIACAVAVCVLVLSVAAVPGPARSLSFTEGTPGDVRALAEATWARFLAVFPSARTCLGPVTVAGLWSLDERADYDHATATIRLRMPGTAANLEATLLHELGHRFDAACPGAVERRATFLRAAGLPSDTPWWHGATWEGTPAERYAEAVVRSVLGAAPPHVLIALDPAEISAVGAAAG
jgi:hypothetical protein